MFICFSNQYTVDTVWLEVKLFNPASWGIRQPVNIEVFLTVFHSIKDSFRCELWTIMTHVPIWSPVLTVVALAQGHPHLVYHCHVIHPDTPRQNLLPLELSLLLTLSFLFGPSVSSLLSSDF
jgi:hypothetical protein